MSDHSIILDHPDKEQILNKLYTSSTPKEVNSWLKIKYPEDQKDTRHLRLSVKVLQDFISNHNDLYEKVATDIAEQKAGKLKRVVSQSLAGDKTYQEIILKAANTELDLRKEFLENIYLIKSRIEQVYDRIQEDPRYIKNADYVLNKHMELLHTLYEKYDKIINQSPSQIIQHNISVQTIDQHTALMQEAVRKVISKIINPEESIKFVEEFTKEISKLKAPKHEPLNQKEMIRDFQNIKNSVFLLEEEN